MWKEGRKEEKKEEKTQREEFVHVHTHRPKPMYTLHTLHMHM